MNDMGELTCCIMNNLIGMDFANIIRIYDLKGSTLKRKVKLTQEQIERSGMKVLKDLNFIDLKDTMDIDEKIK